MIADLPRLMDPKRNGVAILVMPKPNHVWVCERLHCRDMNGMWQFPGGAVEPDEFVRESASRELREETGICAHWDLFNFLTMGVGLTPYNDIYVTHFFYLRTTGYADANARVPANLEPARHGPWELVSFDELRKRHVISLIPFVLDVAEKVQW